MVLDLPKVKNELIEQEMVEVVVEQELEVSEKEKQISNIS